MSGWPEDEEDDDDPGPEAWRGDLHFEDWPENLAGPEYWLYKRWDDEGEEGP